MKKSAEKIGQLVNYGKLSNIELLKLPQVEKKDIPDYIQCPKYEKAKGRMTNAMERYNDKVKRCIAALNDSHDNIEAMKRERWTAKTGQGNKL